jgi:hypothetical protein
LELYYEKYSKKGRFVPWVVALDWLIGDGTTEPNNTKERAYSKNICAFRRGPV